jgi:ferredoxin
VAVRQALRVDPIACTGHGLCADLLPELIEPDEWGFPVIVGDVPAGLAGHARRAVRACPALALRLEPARDNQREKGVRPRERGY